MIYGVQGMMYPARGALVWGQMRKVLSGGLHNILGVYTCRPVFLLCCATAWFEMTYRLMN